MEVDKSEPVKLSNFEVYQLLKERLVDRKNYVKQIKEKQRMDSSKKHQQKDINKKPLFPPNSVAVENKLRKYLEKTTNCKHQSIEKIQTFLKELDRFSLSSTEKLQFLNICPTKFVEIHAIVSDCTIRFEEEDTKVLLRLVKEYLLPENTATSLEILSESNLKDDEDIVEDADHNGNIDGTAKGGAIAESGVTTLDTTKNQVQEHTKEHSNQMEIEDFNSKT